jgi:hypothetical protein
MKIKLIYKIFVIAILVIGLYFFVCYGLLIQKEEAIEIAILACNPRYGLLSVESPSQTDAQLIISRSRKGDTKMTRNDII